MLKARVSQSRDCLEPFHRTAAFSATRHDSDHSLAPWAIDMSGSSDPSQKLNWTLTIRSIEMPRDRNRIATQPSLRAS